MAIDGTAGVVLLAGRLLFGVVLAFMGVNYPTLLRSPGRVRSLRVPSDVV